MQQSYNFSQLHDTLSGQHGTHVWRSAFDGSNELTEFSERRLELRRTFHDTILAQRVRESATISSRSASPAGN
jgi:hypothetical protein